MGPLSGKICDALACAEIPAGLEQAVQRALAEWPQVRLWAVRSSAAIEDLPQASFAGQHETFLNVPREEVLARVRDCWISLFSPRALVYRLRHGLAHEQTGMAVIVQQMIPAERAGVLFTADPASAAGDRIVLEATVGLGDRVVGGQVTPERMVLAKWSFVILERTPGNTLTATATSKRQAQGEETLVTAATGLTALDDATARRLAQLSLRAEQLLGGPLDIEWAVCRGEIHLLQARPITSRAAERSWEDRQVWTNLNTGEVFPDVSTPVTWSLLRRWLEPLFGSVFRLVGADISRSPVAGLVAGRIYFNANTGLAAIKPFSFLLKRIPNLAQALGGGEIEGYRQAPETIPPEDLPDLGFRWPKYILSWPRLLYELLRHSPPRGDAWTVRFKVRMNALARVNVEAMSTEQLTGFFARLLSEGLEGWDFLYLLTQALALPLFQKACRDWLGDPDLTPGYRLFSGLGGIPEVEAALALWRLALLAQADSETAALVRSEATWSQVRARLEPTEHGRQFLAAWTDFMTEHGHHCRGEPELFNARWSETPDYILGLVRGYLGSLGRTDPLGNQARLAREREELTAQCLWRLKNPIKRWLFSRALHRAQRLAINREEWKNQVVRRIAVLRSVLLALGQRLHAQGTLSRPDDVFFLEVSEIEPVATGKTGFKVNELIAARRKEYETNLALLPSRVVVGRFRPTTPEALDTNAKLLTGIPVSPGTATGPAKVILRSDDQQQVLPGEILVAPLTDPAWTPYFIAAGAVVTDQGGILSHGSIVAREYGLPAVTNVGWATRIIHTGDLVQVDGNRGQVMVLQRVANQSKGE